MDFLARPSVALSLSACAISIGYLVWLAVYRLYLHPLAKFPGPKLAALSKWYEFYWDVVCKGRFTFVITDMHKQYGPIVRITPDEVHIMDADYWDTLYSQSSKFDKYEWMSVRFQNSGSVLTTSNHELHKLRRSALNSHFSRRSILKFQPMINEKLHALFKKIVAAGTDNNPVDMKKAWAAFAGDVICQYAFGYSYDHLTMPDFGGGGFHDAYMAVCEFGYTTMQFPIMGEVMKALPDSVAIATNPTLRRLFKLHDDLRIAIGKLAAGEKPTAEHPTIFDEVLQSDLPPEEKVPTRLGDEASSMMGGGIVTTAWALTHATYYILTQPETLAKLRAELDAALPNAAAPLDWAKLDDLPYLGGCVKESIRLSHGVTGRLPRISPDKPMQYKGWSIPAGVPVSMTVPEVHHDEDVFPQSYAFVPERWAGRAKTANGSPLDRYLVAFGKGPRQCLGINLAHAELFLGIAMMIRRLDLEIVDTDESDLLCAHDFFVPSPRMDSKGVKVLVKGVRD